MRALNVKLARNLWTLKGQGAAIALVIATGVATFIMSLASLDSLRLTQQSVYRSQRFADVFAELMRAPESMAERLREISGLASLETRVRAPVNVRLEDFGEPVTGLVLSIPDGRQPQLNRLYLRSGQLPDPTRNDQALVSEAFADAHRLSPGNRLAVVINGRFESLFISGIALSPEYIYQVRPGELVPDFERFAILWMNRSAVAAAFGMEGAFNSVVASLSPGQRPEEVIDRLDRLLAPWGGLGAYHRSDQMSHRYLDDELTQLEAMARFLPMVFIGVAAFLLNVVAARLIRTQREQIAVLKAFGYDNLTVAGHYLALVMVVVLIGSVAGILLGLWIADAVAGLYQEFFRFPWLEFRLRPVVALSGIAIAGGATLLGTLSSVRQAFRLPPAEAMRPEAPASYRRTLLERLGVTWLSQPSRIILRNIERHPWKSTLSVLGIALAVAMMVLTGFPTGSIAHVIDVQFRLAQKQDVTVTFTDPTSFRAVHELSALPGVRRVEGFRTAPAILRHGHRQYRSAVQGYLPDGVLFRLLDQRLQRIDLPPEGILLTNHLGALLDVQPGDVLRIEVQEGNRPMLEVPVAGLVNEYIGVGAYMQRQTLSRLLREGDALSGAFLAVDPAERSRLHRTLEDMPRVAGVTQRETSIRVFDELMGQSLLVMTFVSMIMAGSIAFAVVYNNVRIAFAERGRELASLRVLGFTRAEITFILLGEVVLLTLVAMPPGFVLGALLSWLLSLALQTDVYRIPLVLTTSTYALAALVVLAATLLSSLIMLRSLARLDMVSALKSME
jgi:putative ABC transport system permease protein